MVRLHARPASRLPHVPSEIGYCFLSQRLVNEMLTEADLRAPLETGGVLLGVGDGKNIWIDAVVGPGPAARHHSTSFEPDSNYQQEMIATLYEKSRRTITYLGDWHTHPHSSPHLSWRDRRTLRTISSDVAARQPKPLMMILGGGNPWRVLAWRHQRSPWYRPARAFVTMNIVIGD